MQKIILVMICLTVINIAYATIPHKYIAIDIAHNNLKQQNGYGAALFTAKAKAAYDVAFGIGYNKYLLIEMAITTGPTYNNNVFVPADFAQFGSPNFTVLASSDYLCKQNINSIVISYVPKFEYVNLALSPIVGLALVHAVNQLQLLTYDAAPATSQEQNEFYLKFVTKKFIPTLGLRAQYLIDKNIAVRLGYIWQQTSLLQATATRNINPQIQFQSKYRNSTLLTLGLAYLF